MKSNIWHIVSERAVVACLYLAILTAVKGAASPSTNTATAEIAPTNSASSNAVAALDDTYKLAIGDRVSLRIAEDEDEPKPLTVTDSGDLEAPYIGRVRAENKTCRQLAMEIKTALEKEYYYQATVLIAVDVMTKTHGRVYIVGAVRLPGPVEIPNDEVLTISKAIVRAGSFTDYADKHRVKVTRKGAADGDEKKSFVVDVGEILDKGKIETDLVLQPGDLIFIPDRLIRF
jgi:protein involved in polysaccharide export with SLBB domain